MLYLNHQYPQWFQFLTCTFCHASWAHLSSNIFFLYIFGKAVEEEEGALGVWFSYLITGCEGRRHLGSPSIVYGAMYGRFAGWL